MRRRILCLTLALLCLLCPCLAEDSAAFLSDENAETVYPPAEYTFTQRQYDSYVSDSLIFTIESFYLYNAKCILTKIWVQDPARQIRKANAAWGKSLSAPKELAKKIPEAVLVTNASGYVTKGYPDIPESYPGKPSDYYFTTLGSLVITEGKIFRELEGVPFYGLALSESGINMYRGADNELVLATQPRQTWAFFETCAMQENGIDLLPEQGTWPMASEQHARTVLARVNRNNYLLLHIPYGTELHGMSLYRINEFFFENFETEWVYNLDGGYSTSMLYKPQKKNATLVRLVPNVQKVADILCFTE